MSANENELDRDEALAQLTDEERAAVADDELTDDQRAALEEIANDGEDDDGEGSDDSEDDDAGGEGDDDSGEEGMAAGADDGGEGEDDDDQAEASDGEDDDDDFTPTYKFELPEDFDAQVKAIDDAEADAAAKFKAGDLDADAFIAENRRLAEERRKLDAMRTKAEIAEGMTSQTIEQQWTRKVLKFMSKPQDGIDYKADAAARGDFDAAIKVLGNNPACNEKSFDWFLARAHKMTMALRDQAPPKGKNQPPKTEAGDKGGKDKPADKSKKPSPRKPKVDNLPPNLANVPGGDGPGDVQDEFADIDSLDGIDFERALAKMTPAQRERYLAS